MGWVGEGLDLDIDVDNKEGLESGEWGRLFWKISEIERVNEKEIERILKKESGF